MFSLIDSSKMIRHKMMLNLGKKASKFKGLNLGGVRNGERYGKGGSS